MKQYLVVAGIAIAASVGTHYVMPAPVKVVEKPVQVTVSQSKHAWPDLNEAETIALGESLTALKNVDITIICNDAACNDLAHDLDNAMEIAGARSSLDKSAFPLGYGMAVVTMPNDAKGKLIAAAIDKATAGRIKPNVETRDTKNATSIVIGKKPGR